MEIKVRLSDIVNAGAALNDLDAQRPIARAGHLVARALNVIVKELETYDATRRALAKKHGGKANPQTNRFDFPEGAENAFNDELQELLGTEITLSVDKVKRDDLAECKPLVATWRQLAWLIDERPVAE
jgi:hypothetical protein